MKMKHFLLLALVACITFVSCKKDGALPAVTFTGNVAEGTADNNGEFHLTGRISSTVRLDKVTLTKQGQSTPFLIDESEAKNKNEYDFAYHITGITTHTTIVMDIFNQEGNKVTRTFTIHK